MESDKKALTSIARVAIELCRSYMPMSAKCVTGSGRYRYRYSIRAVKVDDNMLTGIFSA